MVIMTEWNNEEAIAFLQKRLVKAGVEKALEEAGAVDGDEIRIVGRSFDFESALARDPEVAFIEDELASRGRCGRRRLMASRRIVIKVGSSTLTRAGGGVDRDFVGDLVGQVGELIERRFAGRDREFRRHRRRRRATRACRAARRHAGAAGGGVGRAGRADRGVRGAAWPTRGHVAGQVLLTRHDTGHRESFLHARDTFERLLSLGAVPIVNENDTVAVDEIRFGDNDTLAALVATMINADLVVLLSDIEGLYDADPRLSDEATCSRRSTSSQPTSSRRPVARVARSAAAGWPPRSRPPTCS